MTRLYYRETNSGWYEHTWRRDSSTAAPPLPLLSSGMWVQLAVCSSLILQCMFWLVLSFTIILPTSIHNAAQQHLVFHGHLKADTKKVQLATNCLSDTFWLYARASNRVLLKVSNHSIQRANRTAVKHVLRCPKFGHDWCPFVCLDYYATAESTQRKYINRSAINRKIFLGWMHYHTRNNNLIIFIMYE